jgi:hypothetical protein
MADSSYGVGEGEVGLAPTAAPPCEESHARIELLRFVPAWSFRHAGGELGPSSGHAHSGMTASNIAAAIIAAPPGGVKLCRLPACDR